MSLRFSEDSPNYGQHRGKTFELHRNNNDSVVLVDENENLVIAKPNEIEIAHDPKRMGVDVDVFSGMLEHLAHKVDCESLVHPVSGIECTCGLAELMPKIHKTFLAK